MQSRRKIEISDVENGEIEKSAKKTDFARRAFGRGTKSVLAINQRQIQPRIITDSRGSAGFFKQRICAARAQWQTPATQSFSQFRRVSDRVLRRAWPRFRRRQIELPRARLARGR